MIQISLTVNELFVSSFFTMQVIYMLAQSMY